MRGAESPEQLEEMLEDALLLRDAEALGRLASRGCVVRAGSASTVDQLADADAAAGFVADLRMVVQRRRTALLVGRASVNVARRDGRGRWCYAIIVLQEARATHG